MYFWDIKGLKHDLSKGVMRNSDGLIYFLAINLSSSIFLELALYSLGIFAPKIKALSDLSTYSIYQSLISILFTFVLALIAYLINKYVDQGRAFFGRFFSVLWVLSIRFFVFSLSILLVLFLIVASSKIGKREIVQADSTSGLFELIMYSFYVLLFYFRFWLHMYHIAKASSEFEHRYQNQETWSFGDRVIDFEESIELPSSLEPNVMDMSAPSDVSIDPETLWSADGVGFSFRIKTIFYFVLGAIIGGAFGAAIAAFVSSILGGVEGFVTGLEHINKSNNWWDFGVTIIKYVTTGAAKLSQAWISVGIKIGAIVGAFIMASLSFEVDWKSVNSNLGEQ